MIEGVLRHCTEMEVEQQMWIAMVKARWPSRLAIYWALTSCRVSRPWPRKAFQAPSRQCRCLSQPATDSDQPINLGADPPVL